MAIDTASPFIWGANGSQLTPAQAEAQRKVAQVLLTNGMDYSPIKSAWQGAARMAQAALGGFESGQADASDKATAAMQPKLLADAIAASQGGSPAAPVIGGPSGPGDTAVPPAGATAIPAGKDEFVSSVMPLAQEASAKTGLDPRLIVAQAALESGYGQHAPGNNLFGIKSHGQPGGNVLPTSEVVNGQPVQTSDSFRAYASPADSVSGYADFINANPRYAPVKAAQGLEGQAAALGQSGYATDPNYGSKVLQIARALPAPTDGVLAANSPSPLDNAQYPAGPVGAPTQAAGAPPVAAADDGEDALPANAAPAQGTLPTTQAVQAASQPQSAIAKIAPLISAMNNPYASDATKKVAAVLLTSALEQQKQANDPLRQAQLTNAQLQAKKTQQDLDSQGKFAVIGEDNMGRKQYGFVDATTGKVTPYAPDKGRPQASELDPNMHGEEFMGALQQSDPAIASQVRAIVEGRAAYPTGMLLKTPYGQRLAQMVTQADPSFETGNATARVKVRNEFKAGGVASPAGQISAGNTALQHAGEMSDALERMKEDGGILPSIGSAGIPFVSHIANQLHNKAVQGTPSGAALNDFMTAKNHFSEEVTKFYAGSAGSEAERARALANLDAAKSLPELRSAIKTEANLMQGKVNALQERWRNGMGPLVKDFPLISKESQDAIDRVMKRSESSNAPPQAAPAVKEGATIVNPQTGERRVMQGGKWVPVT